MTEPRIERQTRRRAARTPIGSVPPVRNQVRAVPLLVEQLDDGSMRFSSPAARGWAMVARSHSSVLAAIQGAFVEAQIASYARWRGELYELDAITDAVPGDGLASAQATQRRRQYHGEVGYGAAQRRPDTADPGDWEKLPDGRWRSPRGRVYQDGSQMVRRVLQRRREAGLPT